MSKLTLTDYVKYLQDVLQESPELGDEQIFVACDDEGNEYRQVSLYRPEIRYIMGGEVPYSIECLLTDEDLEECEVDSEDAIEVVLI